MAEPCPEFSSSVDAALLLLRCCLRGNFSWDIREYTDGICQARVVLKAPPGDAAPVFQATARMPAAALCAAAVQTLLSEEARMLFGAVAADNGPPRP